MSREELAGALDRLRTGVVASERWAFSTSLAAEDIENLYSDACVDALRGRFTEVADVAAYVRRHVHNRAISLKASPSVARRVPVVAEDRAAAAPGPFDRAVNGELVAVLYEFIAEQSPEDRSVAWLLANGEPPVQIARALQIPRAQATADCKRLRSSLERFVALQTRPAAICARRREDVAAWQRTGRMPLALRWHVRWHHGCALRVRDARQSVRHALMPLAPAVAALLRVGILHQAWHALVGSRVVTVGHDAVIRARRLAPAGGGSAAAGAGAIKAIAVAGAGLAAVHAIAGAPAHPDRLSHPRAIARVAATMTTTTPVSPPVVASRPAPAPVTTTTSTPTTVTTTTTTTPSSPPAAPDGGQSAPPSTVSGSGSDSSATSRTSSTARAAAVSPSGGGSAPTGEGGGTSSSLGAGGSPP